MQEGSEHFAHFLREAVDFGKVYGVSEPKFASDDQLCLYFGVGAAGYAEEMLVVARGPAAIAFSDYCWRLKRLRVEADWSAQNARQRERSW